VLVHQIIERNARLAPDAEALAASDGAVLTWAEVDDLAERVAAVLAQRGVRPGARVSLLARNGLELVPVYAAVNKIGAIYAPLNYRLAPVEIAAVLRDCTPSALLVHEEFADVVAGIDTGGVEPWIYGAHGGPDDLRSQCADVAPRRPDVVPSPSDPSWICYTGGTTGRSKGVVLTHDNMLATARALVEVCGIRPDDTYLVAGPMFHVVLAAPVAYWLQGARTVLVNFDATAALRVISEQRVTRLIATGTIFKAIVEEQERAPRPTVLRTIDFGGAPIPESLARRAAAAFGCDVGQIYGQSETTLLTTYLRPAEYTAAWDGTGRDRTCSVGRAVPGVQLRILDERGEPLPPARVGEVAVRGPAVMREYWRNPEQTAAALRDGWLRTGDLGLLDDDGYLHLRDRLKDVIITGGENVYSSEVELVLARHPQVAEVAVVPVPDEHWGELVGAVVVPAPGAAPDAAALRAFCRERLAGYKLPRLFFFRREVPRLPTGKIAKSLLRDEVRSRAPWTASDLYHALPNGAETR
jgi:acyl-CoA synthetase (AMP-forming)/AMP-acid ligase II